MEGKVDLIRISPYKPSPTIFRSLMEVLVEYPEQGLILLSYDILQNTQ